MYEFFTKNFGSYIIENSKEHLIYLIPGEKLDCQFDWYGDQRAEAFNVLKTKPLKNDIEERSLSPEITVKLICNLETTIYRAMQKNSAVCSMQKFF